MFDILPYLFSHIINDNDNRNARSKRRTYKGNGVNKDINMIISRLLHNITNNNYMDNIKDNDINSRVISLMLSDYKYDTFQIKDYGDRYLIEGNLPGVNKNDIDIDYVKDRITITVNSVKRVTNNSNRVATYVQEGKGIVTSFNVNNIEPSEIKAVFNSNVLRICLPKKNTKCEENLIIDVDNFTET